MIVVLRFIGVMNAAVWFGAAIFFVFGISPAFSTPAIKQLLQGDIYPAAVSILASERFYSFHYWCGSIAIIHQLAEWVYLSRPLQRVTMGVLIGTFILALFGGLWVQPKLLKNHQTAYFRSPSPISPEDRRNAEKTYFTWRKTSDIITYLMVAGLAVFSWRVFYSGNTTTTRFAPTNKFRS